MNKEVSGFMTDEYVKTVLKPRGYGVHKGDCGRVLVIAGGAGMTGAAIFTAKAAMRSGAGLVYLCTAKENFPIIQSTIPEVICVPWSEASKVLANGAGAETEGKTDFEAVSSNRNGYDAVAFGPGMGMNNETAFLLQQVLKLYDGPIVVDADGLNVISEYPELRTLVREYAGELIMTPHIGEAKRLLKGSDEADTKDTFKLIRGIAHRYRQLSIMKGPGTLVFGRSDDDETAEIWVNTTGNAGMATAGSGDVLTGTIASFAAQGMTLTKAAKVGVFIHGRAGDLAAEDKGQYGMIASDIIEQLPYAIKPFTTPEN